MKQLDYMPYALAATYRYEPFNILGMITFEGIAPPAVWQQAIQALQARHPLLNRRLTEEYRLEPLMEQASLLTIQERINDEYWQQAARDALNERIDLTSGPLLRFTLLPGDDRGEIMLAGLHSVIDGASGLNLLHELFANVAAAQAGTPMPYVEPLPELPELDAQLPLAYQRGRRLGKLLRYAAVQMADEVYVQIRSLGKPAAPVHRPSQTDFIPFAVEADLTAALSHRARRERVTLHSVLNAAQMLAAYYLHYSGTRLPFHNFVFSDLRPYLDPPLPAVNLGSFVSMQRFTHLMHTNRSLWELAQEVHLAVYEGTRQGDKFLAYIMARPLLNAFLRIKRDRMGHSALSYPGVVPLHQTYGSLKITDLRVMLSQMWLVPDVSSQVCLFGDRLLWTLIYPAQDMTREQAEGVTETILQILADSV